MSGFGEREGEMWTLCVIVSQEPYVYKCLYIHLQTHLYKYACVVCTCICQQCPMSSEACQTCTLTGNSAPVCAAAALCDFVVPPSLAAGWRRDGIFCKAGEVAGAGLYPWFLIH